MHGVMIELPVPDHLHTHRREIWASIPPEKVREGGRHWFVGSAEREIGVEG